MGLAVIAWQVFIIFTIWISGNKRNFVAGFWVVWTMVQIYALPLSILQFGSILLGWSLSKK